MNVDSMTDLDVVLLAEAMMVIENLTMTDLDVRLLAEAFEDGEFSLIVLGRKAYMALDDFPQPLMFRITNDEPSSIRMIVDADNIIKDIHLVMGIER